MSQLLTRLVVLLVVLLPWLAQAAGPGSPQAGVDSLRHRLATAPAPDTSRAQTLCELGYTLTQLGQHPEARRLLREAWHLSARLGFATGQVRALGWLGVTYQNEGNFDRARQLLDSAVALGERLHEQQRMAGTLLNRARLCNAQDDYACALQSALAARQFALAHHDWPHTAQALNGLGIIYSNHGDYPRAVATLFEAARLARQHHDAQTEVNALGNVGNVYLREKEYEQARALYARLLPRLDSLPDFRGRPAACQDMGIALAHLHRPEAEGYFRQALAGFGQLHAPADEGQVLGTYAGFLREAGRLPEAVAAYQRGLVLLRAADDQNSVASALVGLAETYQQSGRPALAAAPAREALAVAARIHDLPDLQAAAALLARQAKASGDYRQALAYTEQAQAAGDSLFSQAKAEQIGRLQGDYQLRQEQDRAQTLTQRNQQQTLRLSQQRRELWALGAGLAVLTAAGAALALLLRQLRRRARLIERQRTELAELNATKDRLFSLIGHDLRAPLHSLHTFVELLGGPPLPPERLGQYTRHLTQTLGQTLLLLENLLGWAALQLQAGSAPPPPRPVSLAEAAAEALDLLGPSAAAAGIRLHHALPATAQVLADPVAVRLVLRNLLSNAVKFTPAGGDIELNARPEAGRWQLAVRDTGQGLPAATPRQPLEPATLPRRASKAPSAGLGLNLCRDYLRRDGGELQVESPGPGQGCTFYLLLPAVGGVSG